MGGRYSRYIARRLLLFSEFNSDRSVTIPALVPRRPVFRGARLNWRGRAWARNR
jgi:hypothetical protein